MRRRIAYKVTELATDTDRKLVFGRPHVLGAARVRENWFLVSPSMARFCQVEAAVSSSGFHRISPRFRDGGIAPTMSQGTRTDHSGTDCLRFARNRLRLGSLSLLTKPARRFGLDFPDRAERPPWCTLEATRVSTLLGARPAVHRGGQHPGFILAWGSSVPGLVGWPARRCWRRYYSQ